MGEWGGGGDGVICLFLCFNFGFVILCVVKTSSQSLGSLRMSWDLPSRNHLGTSMPSMPHTDGLPSLFIPVTPFFSLAQAE